jgi:ankyrin repeat protein
MKEKNIHVYSLKNQVGKVKNYLKHGGDVDSLGEYDSTPLHCACREGNIEIVKLLIKYGADVNCQNRYSTIYPIFDVLASTTITDSLPIIQLLIEEGADIKVVDSFGNTLLHYAIEKEMIELVKLSISLGCDIDFTERHDKDTPLHYAYLQKNEEIIDYLIKHGANNKKLNIYNKTAESYQE